MRSSKILGFILIHCFIFKVSFSQSITDSTVLKIIDRDVLNLMSKGNIPGLSVSMIKDGHQVIRCYGYANVANKLPVSAGTLFELASCSKAFTALAVLKLAGADSLDLHAYVSDYIPWFRPKYKDSAAKITLLQLLHHTSGIPWQTIADIPKSNDKNALDQTIKKISGTSLHNLPGKIYEYATVNYDILALIIEKVTRRPFEEYIQHNILDSLGFNNTTIGHPKAGVEMATGYKIGFLKPRSYQAPVYRGNYAAGYVISNAEDMARWLKFQMGLTESRLYNLALATHERDETVPLHGMQSYAMGWEVSLSGNGEISHEGLNPNYTSFIAFRPSERTGVAVLTNSNSAFTSVIGSRIMKRITGGKIKEEPDPGDGGDKVFTFLSLVTALYILVVLYLLAARISSIANRRRIYDGVSLKKIGRFSLAILLILPVLYGIYILPRAFAGFTWDAAMVWTPNSFLCLVGLIIASLSISYLIHFVGLCFPGKDDYPNSIPKLLLFSMLSGLANMAVIVLVTSSLDIGMRLRYLVFYYTLVLCVYLFGRRYVQIKLIQLTGRIIYDMRIKLINKIFSTSYQRFEKMERGRIYTALNDDVNTIGESANMGVALVTSAFTTIGAFLYLSSIAFWATLLIAILILIVSTIYYFATTRTNRYFQEARNTQNIFINLVSGMIEGYKELSLHWKKKIAYRDDVAWTANDYRNKITTANTLFTNAFLAGESMLLILLAFVSFVIPKMFPAIHVSATMSFVIVLLYLIGPVNEILNSVPSVLRLRISWNRIQQFLKDIPANLNLEITPPPIESQVKSIRAMRVKFQYKNDKEAGGFSVGPIDLEVKQGEIVFIIGGNGGGKTTLAKLLLGLYDPDEGKILINDRVVTGAQLSEYFSVVFSPSYLFKKPYNIDIREKSKEIDSYLRLLDLEDKVHLAEDGYTTIDLSGGQRKRLALLQCFLEDSPVYLFDEFAADQDPGYRSFFYRTLLPEMKSLGKIVIAITHDDHYFDVADRVFKMEQGILEPYVHEYTDVAAISPQ